MKRIKQLFIIVSLKTLLFPANGMAQWYLKGDYSEGLARVENYEDKWGFIDEAGKLVIPCKWRSADSFSDGTAYVEDEDWEFLEIDKKGKVME